jgi:hypothetical protein
VSYPGSYPGFVRLAANSRDRWRTSFRTNSSPIRLFFRRFDPNAVPPRSLPIVPDYQELVGPLTIELTHQLACFMGIRSIRYSQLPRKLPSHTAASILSQASIGKSLAATCPRREPTLNMAHFRRRERSSVALSGDPYFGTPAALTVLTGGLCLDRTAA